MAKYRLDGRTIPLDGTWDVVVAGGGPSGCTAAAAAAREGARTLLLEASGCLGGMGTAGLLPAWCPFSDIEKIIYRGLAEKVFNACKAGMPHIPKDALDWVPIDPELLKRIYDDLVTGAGVTVLFNSLVCAVDAKKGVVNAVIVGNKSGLTAYRAKVYVDCTGDADVAAWAGAKFQKGDPKTHELQPATLCFIFSNVDTYAYLHGGRLRNSDPKCPIYKVLRSGKYPLIVDNHLCNSLIGPGTVGFNSGHVWGIDNTDPASVSKGLIQGRKIAKQYRDALAEFAPATFGGAFLTATAPALGVRETRRIVGDYVLTRDDYVARRSFNDEICRNSYYIDIHFSRKETALYQRKKLDLEKRSAFYGKGESHGVPYRCLTPKGIRNVLVAGRSISCDRAVQGSVRVTPACLAMGEAAGMAAAMAAKRKDRDVHAIDVKHMRKRLREEGAYLPQLR